METTNIRQGLEKLAENQQAKLNDLPAEKTENLEEGQRKPNIDWDNAKGMRFGMLTVVSAQKKINKSGRLVECLCDCGNKKIFDYANLSRTKSCGCFQKEAARIKHTTHGKTDTTEWVIWHGIKQRCLCKTDKAYHKYGGRGITLCQEWIDSFEKFYEDMGPRPANMSIDRIDNNKGYSKENCRWADSITQCRNKTNNRFLLFRGETKCLSEWAKIFGMNISVLHHRIVKYSWPVDEALLTPVKKLKKRSI